MAAATAKIKKYPEQKEEIEEMADMLHDLSLKHCLREQTMIYPAYYKE